MSSVVIAGNTSGTVTLDAPAVAGTTVLTLPTTNGTILTTANTFGAGTGPTFSAYASATQSISTGTWTKIQVNTEEWDTANCYDSSTNYRFTPNVAGYYQVNAQLAYANTISAAQCKISKNGSDWKYGNNIVSAPWVQVSCLVYLNGSTDYIEFYGAQVSGTSQSTTANTYLNYFQAALVRSA